MIGASALQSPGHGLFLKRCLLASERSIFKKYVLFAVVLRAFMLRRPRPPTQHHPHTDLPNHMAEAPLTSTEMLKSPASPKTGNHCTRAKSKILKRKKAITIPSSVAEQKGVLKSRRTRGVTEHFAKAKTSHPCWEWEPLRRCLAPLINNVRS